MYSDRIYSSSGSQYQSHYRSHYTSSATPSPILSRKFYHDKSASPSTERLNGSFNRGKDGIFRPKSLFSLATEIDFDSAKSSFHARSTPITIATNPRLAQIRARHREESVPRQISRDYDYPSLSTSPRTRSHTLENRSNYNTNFNDNLSYLSNSSRVSNSNFSSSPSSSYYPSSRQRTTYASRYPAYNFTTNLYSAKVRERPLLSNLNLKYGTRKQSTAASRNASISSASSSHTSSVSSNEPARPALERNKFLIKFRENNINQSSERRRSSISWDIPGSFAHTSDKPSTRADIGETITEIEHNTEQPKEGLADKCKADILNNDLDKDNKLARWNGSMALNMLDDESVIKYENKTISKPIKESVVRTINCFDVCTSQELKPSLQLLSINIESKKILKSKSEKIKKKKKKLDKVPSTDDANEVKPETKSIEVSSKLSLNDTTTPIVEDNKKNSQIFETKKEVKDLTINLSETKDIKDGAKVTFDLKPVLIKAKSIGCKWDTSKFEPNQIQENLQTKTKTEIKSVLKPHIKTKSAEEKVTKQEPENKVALVSPDQGTDDKISKVKTADSKSLKIATVELEKINQGKKEETQHKAQLLSNQTTEIKLIKKSLIEVKSSNNEILNVSELKNTVAQVLPIIAEINQVKSVKEKSKANISKLETNILIDNKNNKIETIASAKTTEIKTDLKQNKVKSKSTTEDNKFSKIKSTKSVENNESSKIETTVSNEIKEIDANLKQKRVKSKSTTEDIKVSNIESINLIDNKITQIAASQPNEIKADLNENKSPKSKLILEDKAVKSTNSVDINNNNNNKQVEIKSQILTPNTNNEQSTAKLNKLIKPIESKVCKVELEQVATIKKAQISPANQSTVTGKIEKVAIAKPENLLDTSKIENKSQAIVPSKKGENNVSKLEISKTEMSDTHQSEKLALQNSAKLLIPPKQLPPKSVSLNVIAKDNNSINLEPDRNEVKKNKLDDNQTVKPKSPKTPLSPLIKSPFELIPKPKLSSSSATKLVKQKSEEIKPKTTKLKQVPEPKTLEVKKDESVITSLQINKNVPAGEPVCEPLPSPKALVNSAQIPTLTTSSSVTVKKEKVTSLSEKESDTKKVRKKKKIVKSPTDELSPKLDKVVNEPIKEPIKSKETVEDKPNQLISTNQTTNSDVLKLNVPAKKESFEIRDDLKTVRKVKKKIRFREYSINDFTFLTVLGRGSFGKVLLAELRDHGVFFAVKCLKKQTVIEDDDVESIMIERKVLAYGSNNPFICKLFATFQTESHLFFAMEWCSGGDLMFHVQKEGKFSEDKARFYACEILCALSFLHKRGIIYRDLKLDNIIVFKDGHTRLVDFGMCQGKIYRDEFLPSNFCGTPEYMAPEIIKGVRYNQSVDFWAFGVVTYEMCVGTSPFQGTDEDELLWNVCHQEVHYPRFLSEKVIELISLLLKKDPEDRIGLANCKYGPVSAQSWFRDVDWNLVEKCKIKPPFIPQLMNETDVSYFDRYFTKEEPCISPTLKPINPKDQELFNGFNYTNHHMTE